jgi:phosphopantothenoylcysteine synthetase/decarboxylase
MSSSSTSTTTTTKKKKILLAITGSVAAIKGPEIVIRLIEEFNKVNIDVSIRVVLTRGGEHFWNKSKEYNEMYWNSLQQQIRMTSTNVKNDDGETTVCIVRADDEWKEWNTIGDPVLHIDLRNWADLMLIAPLSAHTLAKMSNGLCDDTVSCVVRAWDFGYKDNTTTNVDGNQLLQRRHSRRRGKPLLLAPAMNTAMWEHPLTQIQLSTIQQFGPGNVHIITPQVKTLACGEVGNGALASVDTIIQTVKSVLLEEDDTEEDD